MIKRRVKKVASLTQEEAAFFESFYHEYKQYIFHIATSYEDNRADLEDMVQEVIIRLIKNIFTLKTLDRCKTLKYIVLTCRSVYIDRERKRDKERLTFLDSKQLEQLYGVTGEHIYENTTASKLAVDVLRSGMSARDWLVLEGAFLMELEPEEISRSIGVSVDSVRMIIHRAKKKARILMEQDAVGGENNG